MPQKVFPGPAARGPSSAPGLDPASQWEPCPGQEIWKEVATPHTALRTPVPSLNRQTLSTPGTMFRLTQSRINSFPSGFCFSYCVVNFTNGQAGNGTLPFHLHFPQYFSDVHFSFSHIDSFYGDLQQCAPMREAHAESPCLSKGRCSSPLLPSYLSRSVTRPAADMEGSLQLAGLRGLSWKNSDIITFHVRPSCKFVK